MFLIKQLRGLEEPDAPSFKRYFYLLEVNGMCLFFRVEFSNADFLWEYYTVVIIYLNLFCRI